MRYATVSLVLTVATVVAPSLAYVTPLHDHAYRH